MVRRSVLILLCIVGLIASGVAAVSGDEPDYSARQWEEVFEEFENHHRSKGSTMKDWNRAWYTWVQKAINFNSPYAKDRVLVE